jgi:hypothetical protein
VKPPRPILGSAAGSGADRHGLADILGLIVSGCSDLAGTLGFEVCVSSIETGE